MALNELGKELKGLLDRPVVKAYLDALANSEGADYNVLFGGDTFKNFKKHPNQVRTFKNSNGKTEKTTAAGRYQFLNSTWGDVLKGTGVDDFSPTSQDIGALFLIRREGALDDLLEGNLGNVTRKVNNVWASLPGSPYPQPANTEAEFHKMLENSLKANKVKEPVIVDPVMPLPPGDPTPTDKELESLPPEPVLDPNRPLFQGFGPEPPIASLAPTIASDGSQAPTPEVPESSLQKLAAIQNQLAMPTAATATGGMQDFQDFLLREAIKLDADSARQQTEDQFFDDEPVTRVELPKAIEQAISRVTSAL